MSCRCISCLFCIFVAVVTAAVYIARDVNTEYDREVTAHGLGTDNPESTTVAASKKVQETSAVDLGALLDAGDGAMVTLSAGDTQLVAHRAVLSARSPVFATMFHHDMPEASSSHITIPDMEGPVLRQLVAYMYTLQGPQLPDMAPLLLAAADKYGLSGLKAACEQQVAAQLTVENAAATALLALRHSCSSLRQAAVAFIKAHTHQVVMTQGWADAVVGHPQSVVELTRLIAEPPAETRTPATAEGGTIPRTHRWPRSYPGRTPVAAATPTNTCHTPPPDEATVSRMRNLSEVEKGRRLIKAAMVGAVEELQALLVAGADVGSRDEAWSNWTALHWAADRGHVEAVRCLVEGGAEVGARTNEENTALHLAAWSGHADVVRQLAVSFIDPNTKNQHGDTPLHFAAQWDNSEAAFALLQVGANREARDINGHTPIDYTTWSGAKQVRQMLTTR